MAYLTPIMQRPYTVNNNQGFIKKKEEEESSQSSRSSHAEQEQPQQQVNHHEQNKSVQQQLADSKASHQAAVASRDANLKNATVNIAQILKDFRNTAKAIGASDELTAEVNTYLSLVESQARKEAPDSKLIRSNLKNASTLLDNYISETLERPSKVVENWIDALFLQQINYRFNDEEVNPNFLVKFPNQKKDEEGNSSQDEEEEQNSQEESKKEICVPQDEKLKSLFIQAKKFAYANDSKKAMELFQEALNRAIEVEDKDTESKVLFEIGKIYDKNDYLSQALTSYSKALIVSNDLSIKTKAHYSMAQIYDDVAQFEPAINHYMSSISYAGENENLAAQATSLTRIGNIFSDKYDKNAFEFLNTAELIANQEGSNKVKGYVSSNLAEAYGKFRESHKALKYFSTAVREYDEAKSPLKVAINYKKAAEVMKNANSRQKAKKLMQKALLKAKQTDDVKLMKEIHDALKMI